MKHCSFFILPLLSLFVVVAPREASAGSGSVGEKSTYPAFQAGVTGAWIRIEPGQKMTVDRIDPGTPAAGQLKADDLILAANGIAIEGPDPRVPLGTALSRAEAESGSLTLSIRRASRHLEAVVKVPVKGDYAPGWPLNCAKSESIIRAHAEYLAGLQTADGWIDGAELWHVMGALFLLSTDNPKDEDPIRHYAKALSKSVENKPSGSTWHLGYHLIFLSEYYLKTGDASVLPAMEAACKVAAEGQVAGAWEHGLSAPGTSVGYVQSGLMNSAGVTLFLGMTLARECGITVHEEAWQRSLVFFYRGIGHGSIPYGDHRAEIFPDTNGRNAAIACAMSLLDGEVYQAAAKHLAMMVADSYASFEAGHTGGGFNVLWRGVSLPHLPDTLMGEKHRRNHMRQLAWYYDLCRLPDGGFSLLPSPPAQTRYASEGWGRGLGLTYTAPLRTLRMTGAPRTQYSKPGQPLPSQPWGTPRDATFLLSTHADGFGQDTVNAHKIQALVESREPVPETILFRLMHHFNPYIRTRAARKLGEMNTEAAYEAIGKALAHQDPRVRRAGCDAISQYDNWRRSNTSFISRDIVSQRFVPHLEAMLNDPQAAWWEIDGVFNALRFAQAEDIRRNRNLIDHYGEHEQWILRESSYWALVGLGKDIRSPELLALAERYNRSRSVFERSAMNEGIKHLFQRERVELDEQAVATFVKAIASELQDTLFEAGYDPFAARQEAAHRTMMILSDIKNPPYKVIASQLAEYLEDWKPSDNMHANWLITGSRWQPGLVKIAEDLGEDAGPIIKQFERCLRLHSWNLKEGRNNQQPAVRAAMQEAVKHFKNTRSTR
ncbi:DUF6288 domain-containing protein [Haloferula sp. A504]|uniref:DUF6288 domain-containing protein n=1 Tax=Haloferula sp. A504 TaxID=3373601 RepID=UPI0031C6502F|nr:DUF6288 domain-containing protein [Verrucomicrobiaceae bacterium E54]